MSTIELELSEEEKAQLLASLTQGLSDSTVTREASDKSVSLKKEKKAFKGPPIPEHRDGMGRYVPKSGEKPLTQGDVPGPGPAQYSPDYRTVVRAFPEYSMGEGVMERRKKRGTPGPNKYDTRGNMVWGKCRGLSLKGRLASRVPEPSPGPAAYDRTIKTIGGPTYSMRTRPKNDLMPGLVSALAKVPDPSVPGPSFRPCEDEWLQRPQTFGSSRPVVRKKKQTCPGPSTYVPKRQPTGPKWRMGVLLKAGGDAEGPGPASYDHKPKFPEGQGVSMGLKYPPAKSKHPTPGPDQYNKEGFRLDEPGFTLKYRWLDRKVERTPGPVHYTCQRDPTAKRPPAYSFRSPWSHGKSSETPGPGEYNVTGPPLDKGKSISLRLEPVPSDTPCPSQYRPEQADLQLPRRAPAFSLSGRNEQKITDENAPGPSSYHIRYDRGGKPGRSMGQKLKRDNKSFGPGPAPSTVVDAEKTGETCPKTCGTCDRGVTLKSRHTPHKFSGFRNLQRVQHPTGEVPSAPLIG